MDSTQNTAARNRITDASLNRAAEGLRVAEDICRFAWDLPGLSGQLKELRHSLLEAFAPQCTDRLGQVAARDTEEDVGRAPPESSRSGEDLQSLAVRNLQRAKEAIRTLEEVARSGGSRTSAAAVRANALRYRLYSIEKGLLRIASCPANRMRDVLLYLVATESVARIPLAEAVEAAIAGGAGAVQLREKGMPDRRLLELGRSLREVTARRGVPLIINDRPDLALLLGADGVHLGQNDLPMGAARRILGPDLIVGVSTHEPEEARRAVREGADYIGMGPAFPTSTKVAGPPLGPEGLGRILGAVELPAFAIGGIGPANAALLAAGGCRRAAVCAGVLAAGGAEGIEEAARSIVQALCNREGSLEKGAPIADHPAP